MVDPAGATARRAAAPTSPTPLTDLRRDGLLIFSHSSLLGGAERFLLEAVSALGDRGVPCRVVIPGRGPLLAELDAAGVPFQVFGFNRWTAVRGTPRLRRAARLVVNLARSAAAARLVRRDGCAAVASNTISAFVGAFGARLAGVRHLWLVHEAGLAHADATFDVGAALAGRLMAATAVGAVLPSRYAAEAATPWFASRHVPTVVMAQAVTVRPAPLPPEWRTRHGFRMVIVADVVPPKRQLEAVRALPALLARGLDAELVLVGHAHPEYRRVLERAADDLGVAERLHLAGFADNPFPFVESAHAAVVTSRFESFGRATVEAMLAGTPVVAADSGASPEILAGGELGLLYPPGDTDALADRLASVHDAPDAARSRALRARDAARSLYSREHFAAALEDALDSLLSARPSPRRR